MDRHKFPPDLTGIRQKEQHGRAALSRLRRRFCQAWHGLPKAQKCVVIVALLEFFWIAALQFQVYELADTVSTQRVRMAQLEKQAKKQNNMLYSVIFRLADTGRYRKEMAPPQFPRPRKHLAHRRTGKRPGRFIVWSLQFVAGGFNFFSHSLQTKNLKLKK